MAYLYLIKEVEKEVTKYKIGVTTEDIPSKRLKKLQTGNSSKLTFLFLFETAEPFKLETMMHFHYKSKNVLNEWYNLSREDINEFLSVCEKKEKIIRSLSDNPFF
jgi:hypothetical protein